GEMAMEPIFLPQLAHAPQQAEHIAIQTQLADLETLTPVQGQMQVMHCGNYLQVEATAETIITLTCDRCLQQYNHRLATQASELIWLRDATAADALEGFAAEVLEDPDLVESLPPDGYFYPNEWLYEQLCLALPQRQLCSAQCPGIALPVQSVASEPSLDRRWAVLADLKHQLNQDGR
ncbi:MAG: YceD family protein, partial [Thermosynechococcaceae cyanobacterium]